jgi:hypothetical protein
LLGTNFYASSESLCLFYDTSDSSLYGSSTAQFRHNGKVKCEYIYLPPGSYEVKYQPNGSSGDLYANSLTFQILSRPVLYSVDLQLAKIGDLITVTGRNFDSDVEYFCSFEADSSVMRMYYIAATYVDSTTLQCPTSYLQLGGQMAACASL